MVAVVVAAVVVVVVRGGKLAFGYFVEHTPSAPKGKQTNRQTGRLAIADRPPSVYAMDLPLYTRTCPPLFFEPTPPGTPPGPRPPGRVPSFDGQAGKRDRRARAVTMSRRARWTGSGTTG